ncbi:MAG: gluconolaconase, partial [Cyanobacteria bacterium REEB65]|nr:gluconolaconase [Cyanobacteria bacterium REEB65]
LYVADTDNFTIRRVTPSGAVSTLAGSPGQFGDADGPAAQARFDGPTGLAVRSDGTIYVADTNNNTIRAISPGGVVTTIAGSGYRGYVDGPDGLAKFDAPSGLVADGQGNLLVADTLNNKIRKVVLR